MRHRLASLDDLARIRDMEHAAGQAFRSVGMDEIADDEPIDAAGFASYVARGDAWVTVDDDESVVAYLLLERLDEAMHVEQVTVHPSYARRGHGARLLEVARQRAGEAGVDALTLTTFRDVPWNAPYYARLGWTELPTGQWGPELARRVAAESAHGLSAWPRVVMFRRIDEGRLGGVTTLNKH